MCVTAGPAGEPQVELQPLGAEPSWRWEYAAVPGRGVVLRRVEQVAAALAAHLREAAAAGATAERLGLAAPGLTSSILPAGFLRQLEADVSWSCTL